MNARRFSLLMILTTSLLLAFAGSASAHTTKFSDDGKVKFVWGWMKEPATTYMVNELDLRISDNSTGAGIANITDANLSVKLTIGEEEYVVSGLKAPWGKAAGNYTGGKVITPTLPGIYVLHLQGTINGSPINISIPSNHEMTDIEETYWPAPADKDAALMAHIKTLENEIAALKAKADHGHGNEDLEQRIAALETEVTALKAKAQTQSQTPATVTPVASPTAVAENPVPAVGILALVGVLVFVALRRKAN